MTKEGRGLGLSESIEDYIERIYLDQIQDGRGVRITDLAAAMEVSKASANDAVKKLKNMGYVDHERYGQIYLTDTGIEAGKKIYNRHTVLTTFFERFLDIDPKTAETDACGIEHILSEKSFKAINKLVRSLEK